jgi:hypothetical protein
MHARRKGLKRDPACYPRVRRAGCRVNPDCGHLQVVTRRPSSGRDAPVQRQKVLGVISGYQFAA